MQWADVVNDPSLRNLPYKIELNQYGQIVMTPHWPIHSEIQSLLQDALNDRLAGGRAVQEYAIQTSAGVRVADVVWRSEERWQGTGSGLAIQHRPTRLSAWPDRFASNSPAGSITPPRAVTGAKRSNAIIRTAWTGSPHRAGRGAAGPAEGPRDAGDEVKSHLRGRMNGPSFGFVGSRFSPHVDPGEQPRNTRGESGSGTETGYVVRIPRTTKRSD